MNKLFPIIVSLTLMLGASSALAQIHTGQDRFTFGEDAIVHAGDTVEDLVTMGGDAVVDGNVLGDVVTMGGDAHVRGEVGGDVVTMGGDLMVDASADVRGDLVASGGQVLVEPGASVSGTILDAGGGGRHGPFFVSGMERTASGVGGYLSHVFSSMVSHVLLFVLGLLLMGAARERLDALQVVMVRQPLRSLAMGVMGFVAAVVGVIVLAITIIGIPAAVVVALTLPLCMYVGLAAAASVLGAMLPIEQLKGRPVLQLGAGVVALFLASLVPVLGSIAVAIVAAMGLGSLVITRFGTITELHLDGDPTPDGPYRTRTA